MYFLELSPYSFTLKSHISEILSCLNLFLVLIESQRVYELTARTYAKPMREVYIPTIEMLIAIDKYVIPKNILAIFAAVRIHVEVLTV